MIDRKQKKMMNSRPFITTLCRILQVIKDKNIFISPFGEVTTLIAKTDYT